MMKKTIAVLLNKLPRRAWQCLISMLMILSLAACGNSADRAGQPSAEESPAEEIANNEADSVDGNEDSIESGTGNEADSAESVTDDDVALENNNADDVKNTEISETQQGESESPEEQGAKVLVAYFSATNTTKGVAEQIANGLHADLYEIVPEEPYTDADLNYNDNNSRTTIEMNDPNARPAISGSVENMEEYDIVFIGYAGGIIGLNQEKPINQGFALV